MTRHLQEGQLTVLRYNVTNKLHVVVAVLALVGLVGSSYSALSTGAQPKVHHK